MDVDELDWDVDFSDSFIRCMFTVSSTTLYYSPRLGLGSFQLPNFLYEIHPSSPLFTLAHHFVIQPAIGNQLARSTPNNITFSLRSRKLKPIPRALPTTPNIPSSYVLYPFSPPSISSTNFSRPRPPPPPILRLRAICLPYPNHSILTLPNSTPMEFAIAIRKRHWGRAIRPV